MHNGTDVIYWYDGSFDGLLCCVFESIYQKEMPLEICIGPGEASLFPVKEIVTDPEKAQRVLQSIPKKISSWALSFVKLTFLTCLPEKELHILRFLRLGYRVGKDVTRMLGNDTVAAMRKAVLHLKNERHLLCGLLRFSDYDGVLVAQIEPKNDVLPLLAGHFSSRYANETFLIYDKNRKAALLYSKGKVQLASVETLELPQPGAAEQSYRALWRRFYETVAIESRYNPKCRMTHMPKRYWGNMTEFLQQQDVPRGIPDGGQRFLPDGQ